MQTNVMLYSLTKGVKQKYILYISGSVAYRQYIHKCSSPWNPDWLTAVSQFSALSAPPDLSLLQLSAAESSLPNGSQTLSQAPLLTACGWLFPPAPPAKPFKPVYQGPRWVGFMVEKCGKILWHWHFHRDHATMYYSFCAPPKIWKSLPPSH